MKEEIETNKKRILIVFVYAFLLTMFNLYHCDQKDNRLNEHKRLLIAQQTQINQLILNAKKNELNK